MSIDHNKAMIMQYHAVAARAKALEARNLADFLPEKKDEDYLYTTAAQYYYQLSRIFRGIDDNDPSYNMEPA